MTGVLISCCFMLACSYMGGGVWALVGGYVVLSFSKLILTFVVLRWTPGWHFMFHEARSYIKFGMMVALGRSMSYIWQNSDRFFIGRCWSPQTVGYYTFALELSQLPTEKITVLINQVSFPVFSKLQDSEKELSYFYLKIVKITMIIVLPLFVGGYLVADELIHIVMGSQWQPIVFIFKFLCLTQVMTSLNAVNSFVHYALGRPRWPLYFNTACAVIMSLAFYMAAKQGLNAMLIPWFTAYLIVCCVWVYMTIMKINISLFCYLRNIIQPCMSAIIMLASVIGLDYFFTFLPTAINNPLIILVSKIFIGAISYTVYLLAFEKGIFMDLRLIRKSHE